MVPSWMYKVSINPIILSKTRLIVTPLHVKIFSSSSWSSNWPISSYVSMLDTRLPNRSIYQLLQSRLAQRHRSRILFGGVQFESRQGHLLSWVSSVSWLSWVPPAKCQVGHDHFLSLYHPMLYNPNTERASMQLHGNTQSVLGSQQRSLGWVLMNAFVDLR
jgi:hypothetical protein